MRKILAILAVLTTAFALGVQAQSPTPTPTPAPIVVPSPTVLSVTQPIRMTLSPAQVQELVAALSSAGVNIPAGVVRLSLDVIPAITGTDGVVRNPTTAGGANVYLSFK